MTSPREWVRGSPTNVFNGGEELERCEGVHSRATAKGKHDGAQSSSVGCIAAKRSRSGGSCAAVFNRYSAKTSRIRKARGGKRARLRETERDVGERSSKEKTEGQQ